MKYTRDDLTNNGEYDFDRSDLIDIIMELQEEDSHRKTLLKVEDVLYEDGTLNCTETMVNWDLIDNKYKLSVGQKEWLGDVMDELSWILDRLDRKTDDLYIEFTKINPDGFMSMEQNYDGDYLRWRQNSGWDWVWDRNYHISTDQLWELSSIDEYGEKTWTEICDFNTWMGYKWNLTVEQQKDYNFNKCCQDAARWTTENKMVEKLDELGFDTEDMIQRDEYGYFTLILCRGTSRDSYDNDEIEFGGKSRVDVLWQCIKYLFKEDRELRLAYE